MTPEEALGEFRAAGAYLEGHFVLSSGLHSPVYLQCARALMNPGRAARLCGALADRVRETGIGFGLCVSPALGGVVAGFETARQLGVDSVFAERELGDFSLRRGFAVRPGQRCLVVEDVVTTGGSVAEVVELLRDSGAEVPLTAALVDRSGGNASTGAPLVSVLQLEIPTYPADALPPELAAIPPDHPGSKRMQS